MSGLWLIYRNAIFFNEEKWIWDENQFPKQELFFVVLEQHPSLHHTVVRDPSFKSHRVRDSSPKAKPRAFIHNEAFRTTAKNAGPQIT